MSFFGISLDCLEWISASARLDFRSHLCVWGGLSRNSHGRMWILQDLLLHRCWNCHCREFVGYCFVLFIWALETSWQSDPQWDWWNGSCRQTAISFRRAKCRPRPIPRPDQMRKFFWRSDRLDCQKRLALTTCDLKLWKAPGRVRMVTDQVLAEKLDELSKHLVAETYGGVQAVKLARRAYNNRRGVVANPIWKSSLIMFEYALSIPSDDKMRLDWGDNKRESHAVCFFCARKFWQIPAERKGHWPSFCLISQNGELMHAVSSLCEGMLVRWWRWACLDCGESLARKHWSSWES